MEKFMILLSPEEDSELAMLWEASCKDVEEAKKQATAYLAMAGKKYKFATVLSNFKSSFAWRQACDKIFYNFNL